MEWQLIETAPRDGSYILLWRPEHRRPPKHAIGFWNPHSGWMLVQGAAGVNATHWMPLPLPPVTP